MQAVERNLRFHFTHLSYQHKQMTFGHRPIYLVVSHQEYLDLTSGRKAFYQQDWQRVPEKMSFINKDAKLGVSFECPIREDIKPSDHILLAYTFPFNMNDVEYSLKQVEEKCNSNDDIHFERSKLTESLEGRNVDLITLSTKQAFAHKKPTIFMTCRVHCGETPAQYMLQGVLDTLTDFDDL